MNLINSVSVEETASILRSVPKDFAIDMIMVLIGQFFSISSISEYTRYKFRDIDFIIFYYTIHKILTEFYDELLETGISYMEYLCEGNQNINDIRYRNTILLFSRCLAFYQQQTKLYYSVTEVKHVKHNKIKKPVFHMIVNPMSSTRLSITSEYIWTTMCPNLIDLFKFLIDLDNPGSSITLLLKVSNLISEYSAVYSAGTYEPELIREGTNNYVVQSRKISNFNKPYATRFVPFQMESPNHSFSILIDKYKERVDSISAFRPTDPDHFDFCILLFVLTAMYKTTNNEFRNLSKLAFYNLDAVFLILQFVFDQLPEFRRLFSCVYKSV